MRFLRDKLIQVTLMVCSQVDNKIVKHGGMEPLTPGCCVSLGGPANVRTCVWTLPFKLFHILHALRQQC